jgi:hypothetical protein
MAGTAFIRHYRLNIGGIAGHFLEEAVFFAERHCVNTTTAAATTASNISFFMRSDFKC